jgi:hypothetical protein
MLLTRMLQTTVCIPRIAKMPAIVFGVDLTELPILIILKKRPKVLG